MTDDELRYYPDSLELDENVVYSYKPEGFLSRFSSAIYYITDKRIFLEKGKNKKKVDGVDYSKIRDIHLRQTEAEKEMDIGTILIEHSNHKKHIPVTKKRYFVLPKIKDPETAFLKIKKEFTKHEIKTGDESKFLF